jgi:hypothetical protein
MSETLKELLARHQNPVFAATVLGNGDIIQSALDAGFVRVVGATTDGEHAALCRERFGGRTDVEVYDGDEIILMDVLQDLNVCITFGLSATSTPPPALIHELACVRHHRIKTHTFLIQDTHLLGTDEAGGLTGYQVRMMLLEINNLYRVKELPELNMLVATVP